MDYKSVFTNLCLELQQNRSWIKGLGKNPQKSELIHCDVPFVRGHRSVFPRTPRNTGVYTRHPTFVTATSGVLTRTRLPFTRCPTGGRKKIACIYGLRSEGVKTSALVTLLESPVEFFSADTRKAQSILNMLSI